MAIFKTLDAVNLSNLGKEDDKYSIDLIPGNVYKVIAYSKSDPDSSRMSYEGTYVSSSLRGSSLRFDCSYLYRSNIIDTDSHYIRECRQITDFNINEFDIKPKSTDCYISSTLILKSEFYHQKFTITTDHVYDIIYHIKPNLNTITKAVGRICDISKATASLLVDTSTRFNSSYSRLDLDDIIIHSVIELD